IVGRRIEGYSSGDHRSRQADEDGQHCYSHPWRIALLERFWQARHPPRYAAYLIPSSPSFPLSSSKNLAVCLWLWAKPLVQYAVPCRSIIDLATTVMGISTRASVQRAQKSTKLNYVRLNSRKPS